VVREYLDADVAREAAGAFGRHPNRSFMPLWDIVEETEGQAYSRAYDAVYDAHGYYCGDCRDSHLSREGGQELEAIKSLLPASYLEWQRIRRW